MAQIACRLPITAGRILIFRFEVSSFKSQISLFCIFDSPTSDLRLLPSDHDAANLVTT